MHVPFKGCIAVVMLLGLTFSLSAQQPSPATSAKNILQPVENASNGVQQLTGDAKQTGRRLLQPGKQQLDSLLQAGKQLSRSIIPRIDLFNVNKAIRVSDYHADVDYTYLKDTTGLSTGMFRPMNAMLGYNAGFTLSLGNLPFHIS